ncbi:hypothetical protein KSF_050720 [Reticulibacter mediterranei]|uniref:Uncharacterized protein n=1 Tax=Reticulibacter mediterranei TaxID=2778369 RepID=A0A8J3IGF9_9CHLR|nr:hypothetical protein [Reticulibacter mediterranei]GHO95024.1 hypothetical protein KSF_050720 [Reticulibacter mediterranei]
MTDRHGRSFEVPTSYPESSRQPPTSGDAFQWYAQPASAEALGSNSDLPGNHEYKAYRDRLLQMEWGNRHRSAAFEPESSGNPKLPEAPLDKRALEARYRRDVIKKGNEEYKTRLESVNRFNWEEQANFARSYAAKFNRSESVRQAQRDHRPNWTPLDNLAQQAELARLAQGDQQANWTPLADLAQAQRHQMSQGQPPHPEYPGPGDGFQQ